MIFKKEGQIKFSDIRSSSVALQTLQELVAHT